MSEFQRDPAAVVERIRREPVVVLDEAGAPWITLNPPWQPDPELLELAKQWRKSRLNQPARISEQAYAQAWRALRGETAPPLTHSLTAVDVK